LRDGAKPKRGVIGWVAEDDDPGDAQAAAFGQAVAGTFRRPGGTWIGESGGHSAVLVPWGPRDLLSLSSATSRASPFRWKGGAVDGVDGGGVGSSRGADVDVDHERRLK